MNESDEVILKVVGEGGSVTLLGRQDIHGDWRFAHSRNESALLDFLAEDESLEVHSMSKRWIESWPLAVEKLNQYPWRLLYPEEVHVDFRDRVWNLIGSTNMPSRQLDLWRRVCAVESRDPVRFLAEWLRASKRTVVLTGAGMSTESGVPDFRSPSGWWRNIDPATVATVEALEDNYELFHEFYSARIRALANLKPNIGHDILAEWQQQGLVQTVVTQNVDGFHQMAGSVNVYELHGSIRTCRCQGCRKGASTEDFLQRSPCTQCGGRLRPNVVLFDEMLPQEAWQNAEDAVKSAELVVVLGTSLNVYPANRLPTMTAGKTVIINLESTPMDNLFDLAIHGRIGKVLQGIKEKLDGVYGSLPD